jgi:hypothetical protein
VDLNESQSPDASLMDEVYKLNKTLPPSEDRLMHEKRNSYDMISGSRTHSRMVASTMNRRVLRKGSTLDSVEMCYHFLLGKRREVINVEPFSLERRASMRRDQPAVQRGTDGEF